MRGVVVVAVDGVELGTWPGELARMLGRRLDVHADPASPRVVDVDGPDFLTLEAQHAASYDPEATLVLLRADLPRWLDPQTVCVGGPLVATMRGRLSPPRRRALHGALRPMLAGRVVVQPLIGPARSGLGVVDALCAGLGVVRLPAVDVRIARPREIAAMLRRMGVPER